jgi:hypothetical protein
MVAAAVATIVGQLHNMAINVCLPFHYTAIDVDCVEFYVSRWHLFGGW